MYLGRDKTVQLLEELVSELQLTDPVSSGVTHMDNPPYYRITSSYKVPSVTSGEKLGTTDYLVSTEKLSLLVYSSTCLLCVSAIKTKANVSHVLSLT